jgi:hypothetical protein
MVGGATFEEAKEVANFRESLDQKTSDVDKIAMQAVGLTNSEND